MNALDLPAEELVMLCPDTRINDIDVNIGSVMGIGIGIRKRKRPLINSVQTPVRLMLGRATMNGDNSIPLDRPDLRHSFQQPGALLRHLGNKTLVDMRINQERLHSLIRQHLIHLVGHLTRQEIIPVFQADNPTLNIRS
ncbi:hypothetical protein RBH19_09065 [Natronospira sp. AB-CW4]|uniref:Uncharacterized protein n=1 Tax=Natronospira bacteriovora TaxID=3069753 RepID=A0ABU0W7N6_9GAMM|nr:hypothetical protein [Natronospira sp. AB-CW4]MDQ2070024.1 hypothetical protein [Natronospira sp. AB-CW4]